MTETQVFSENAGNDSHVDTLSSESSSVCSIMLEVSALYAT
jgi:hypothetical protein